MFSLIEKDTLPRAGYLFFRLFAIQKKIIRSQNGADLPQ